MRQDLEDRLFRRWPAVFRGRGKPSTETLMGRGCTHGDGWYGILDALCEVLTTHANDPGRLPPEARQVKEKLAGLRFYVGDPRDDFDCGAIAMAEALSLRICEISGQPGRICSREGSGCRTLSPIIAARKGFVPSATDADPPRPSVPELARILTTRRAEVLAGPIALPGGWSDLVDVLIACLSEPVGDARSAAMRLIDLRQENGCLVGRTKAGALRERGVTAFAAAVSMRIDPLTGAAWVPRRVNKRGKRARRLFRFAIHRA
jgi:hypothetical protein